MKVEKYEHRVYCADAPNDHWSATTDEHSMDFSIGGYRLILSPSFAKALYRFLGQILTREGWL